MKVFCIIAIISIFCFYEANADGGVACSASECVQDVLKTSVGYCVKAPVLKILAKVKSLLSLNNLMNPLNMMTDMQNLVPMPSDLLGTVTDCLTPISGALDKCLCQTTSP